MNAFSVVLRLWQSDMISTKMLSMAQDAALHNRGAWQDCEDNFLRRVTKSSSSITFRQENNNDAFCLSRTVLSYRVKRIK
jgi:hypothetical protein